MFCYFLFLAGSLTALSDAHHSENDQMIKAGKAGVHSAWYFAPVWAWIIAQIAVQKDQAVLWVPVCFALGVALYFSLPNEPELWVGLAGTIGALAALWKARHHPVLLYALAALALCIFGFTAAQVKTARAYTPMLSKTLNAVTVIGTIETLEILADKKGRRVVLKDVELDKATPDKTPRKVRITIRKYEGLKLGDRISLKGRLSAPSEAVVPGGYNFARAFFFKGIGGIGFAYNAPEILEANSKNSMRASILNGVNVLRAGINDRLQAAMNARTASIASALITGHKSGINGDDRDAIRAAGLAHLLAISGLHIGLVSGLIFFAARLVMAGFEGFALHHPIKTYAAIIALVGAVFYMFIAGATIPTQRAVFMTGTILLAVILERSPLSLRLVSVAALVVLAIAPQSLLSVSFQLSFAAVIGLVVFYDLTREFWTRISRSAGMFKSVWLYLLGVGSTTVIATLMTLPLSVYHFQTMPIYGVLGNMIAVPLMGIAIMPVGVVALLAMPFGLEEWPLYIMGQGIDVILDLSHAIYNLPHSVVYTHAVPLSALVAFVSGALWLILVKGWAKVLAVVPLAMMAVSLMTYQKPDVLFSPWDNLMMMRGVDGEYMVSNAKADKFKREAWIRSLGLTGQSMAEWGDNPDLQCDDSACRTLIKDRRVSFIHDPYVIQAECGWADVVLSSEAIDGWRCRDISERPNVKIVDKWDGWRYGVYALTFRDDRVVIKNTRGHESRPWSMTKKSKSKKPKGDKRKF
jgi:competence protein ComEC